MPDILLYGNTRTLQRFTVKLPSLVSVLLVQDRLVLCRGGSWAQWGRLRSWRNQYSRWLCSIDLIWTRWQSAPGPGSSQSCDRWPRSSARAGKVSFIAESLYIWMLFLGSVSICPLQCRTHKRWTPVISVFIDGASGAALGGRIHGTPLGVQWLGTWCTLS